MSIFTPGHPLRLPSPPRLPGESYPQLGSFVRGAVLLLIPDVRRSQASRRTVLETSHPSLAALGLPADCDTRHNRCTL